jgi:hypothetical protein
MCASLVAARLWDKQVLQPLCHRIFCITPHENTMKSASYPRLSTKEFLHFAQESGMMLCNMRMNVVENTIMNPPY